MCAQHGGLSQVCFTLGCDKFDAYVRGQCGTKLNRVSAGLHANVRSSFMLDTLDERAESAAVQVCQACYLWAKQACEGKLLHKNESLNAAARLNLTTIEYAFASGVSYFSVTTLAKVITALERSVQAASDADETLSTLGQQLQLVAVGTTGARG